MTVYGLTGKTGAGKSTVAAFLKEKGFYIIDGDVIARSITEKGRPALKELSDFFGSDIINPDGSLDRKKLASRAFADKESTDMLNAITHPHIYADFLTEIEKAKKEGYDRALIDAAAILESECKSLCDKIIVVTAPEDIRLERILSRDSITREQALTRMNAQKSDEYYFSHADIIVRNYPPYDFDEQIKEIE
mgnify:CR=1 FL=1